jgi:hypothetical protein
VGRTSMQLAVLSRQRYEVVLHQLAAAKATI